MNIRTIECSKIKTVIFDLDGTLINSAPAILTGLEKAIKKSGLLSALPLDSSLVGPPLKDVLQKLVGVRSDIDLDAVASDFKAYYDTEGFMMSVAYPGVHEMLRQLKKANISLYLATNKRAVPTLKIVDYFDWTSLFNEIYAIDKFTDSPFSNKAAMIKTLIQVECIEKAHAIYVGDRIEDLEASLDNGICTILVNWGYGDFDNNPVLYDAKYVDSTQDLLEMIAGLQ